jgi:putative oxidoreductase
MNDNNGKLILRVTLGFLILLHGIAKLRNGVDFIGDALAASGLPVIFKYGAYIGEVLAPVMLILGYYARIGAWLIAVNMLFAIGLVFWGEVFAIDPQTGGLAIEKEYVFFFCAIALGLMGPGRLAINQQ